MTRHKNVTNFLQFLSFLTVTVRFYHQQSTFEYSCHSIFVCFSQLLISWWYNHNNIRSGRELGGHLLGFFAGLLSLKP